MTSSRPLGIAGLLLATSAWGSLFLIGKPVVSHIDPVWFTFIRYTLATAAFAALVFLRGARDVSTWTKLRRHALQLAPLGFMGYGLFSTMALIGLMHSVPSHGAVIMATMPVTTQLVRWARDGIRPTRAALAGTGLAMLGVVIVSGVLSVHAAQAEGGRATMLGDFITLVGTLGWIAYSRGTASHPALDVIEYSALTAIAAWPLLLIGAVLSTALQWVPAPSVGDLASTWHALLYIGIVPSVIAVLAYNFGVKTLGVVTGTAFLNFVPVSALLMSVALGTAPTVDELLGLALVITGLLVHTMSQQAAARPAAVRKPAGPCPVPRAGTR